MTLLQGLLKVGLWTFRNCHWLVNETFKGSPKGWIVDFYKLSLTGQWHFLNILMRSVIDWSMTVLMGLQKVGLWTFRNCHWPVNDSFRRLPKKMLKEIVIDWSMTVWVTNIARTYGHVSLTPVNDTKFMDICYWLQSMTEIYGQTCQKVSLTAVNDKKKCHWLDVYYTGPPL